MGEAVGVDPLTVGGWAVSVADAEDCWVSVVLERYIQTPAPARAITATTASSAMPGPGPGPERGAGRGVWATNGGCQPVGDGGVQCAVGPVGGALGTGAAAPPVYGRDSSPSLLWVTGYLRLCRSGLKVCAARGADVRIMQCLRVLRWRCCTVCIESRAVVPTCRP